MQNEFVLSRFLLAIGSIALFLSFLIDNNIVLILSIIVLIVGIKTKK